MAMRWTREITPAQVLQLFRAKPDPWKALLVFDSATAEYPSGFHHDLPILTSTAALLPILCHPPTHLLLLLPPDLDATRHNFHVFLFLNILIFLTGLYLLLLNSVSSKPIIARLLLVGAILLLLLPICITAIVCARDWARRTGLSTLPWAPTTPSRTWIFASSSSAMG